MAGITRFTPLEDTLDDLFRGFFVRPVAFEGSQQHGAVPRGDCREG